jgi:carbon monoxide dehydrogenase subunit G
MATLHKEIFIDVPADTVWDAIRDVGALHTRLVPGFVRDTRLEGEVRVVTFGNGMTVREPIVSNDDARRRLAWTLEGGSTQHYNGVMQVFAEGSGSRVTWTSDLLPNAAQEAIGAMQDQGLATMKKTLEAAARSGQ